MDGGGQNTWLKHLTSGKVAFDRNEHSLAAEFFQAAIAELEQADPRSTNLAECLESLAKVYVIQGRCSQAEQLFARALSIREEANGADSPQLIVPIRELALFYHVQLRFDRAEKLYKRLLAIEERSGNHGIDEADTLESLAEVYADQARHRDAVNYLRKALSLRERLVGAEHPSIAQLYIDMSEYFEELGDVVDAEQSQRCAFQILRKCLGPQNPKTLSSLKRTLALQEQRRRREEMGQHEVSWQG